MKPLDIIADVIILAALVLNIWSSHRQQTLINEYAAELNQLSSKQFGCEVQLRACHMGLDALEAIYQGADGH